MQAASPATDTDAWLDGASGLGSTTIGPWSALPETLPWQAMRGAAGRAHQAALLRLQARCTLRGFSVRVIG